MSSSCSIARDDGLMNWLMSRVVSSAIPREEPVRQSRTSRAVASSSSRPFRPDTKGSSSSTRAKRSLARIPRLLCMSSHEIEDDSRNPLSSYDASTISSSCDSSSLASSTAPSTSNPAVCPKVDLTSVLPEDATHQEKGSSESAPLPLLPPVNVIAAVTVIPLQNNRLLWHSGLPSDVWLDIIEGLRPQDLARLGAVCKELRPLTEKSLYKSVLLTRERALVSFMLALLRQPSRASLVQHLRVDWLVAGPVAGYADRAFHVILRKLNESGLRDVEVFAGTTSGRFAAGRILPQSLQSLNTSAAFFRRSVRKPLQSLQYLSLRMRAAEVDAVLNAISRVGDTLIKLRLVVQAASPFQTSYDSPARLCAKLRARNLRYLEVREEPLERRTNPWKSYDLVDGTHLGYRAAERLPRLGHLVWKPTWCRNDVFEETDEEQFAKTVEAYCRDLVQVLDLTEFIIILPEGYFRWFEGAGWSEHTESDMIRYETWWKGDTN